jgi:hypothetical protein
LYKVVLISFFVNAVVICVIAAELVATSLGMATADQLLVSSALSGLLTILSFKLSKEALLQINSESDALDSPDKEASADA